MRALAKLFEQEDINFLLTNRIPRRWLTQFMGWFSKIEQPLVRDASIGLWRAFSGLDLSEARDPRFPSMHACFTRKLKEGARPIDPDPAFVISPCDAIVGAHGQIAGDELFQIKGAPYSLLDLLGDAALAQRHRNGTFITLRLTSGMYHRFHAPHDLRVEHVTYISGDTWNVNPIALRRIDKLFCKNERAAINARLATGELLTLIPVAAILVASIRLHCLKEKLDLSYRGPNVLRCATDYRRGDEMGWFEHGSTIVMLAPGTWSFADGVETGTIVRMGRPLFRLPPESRYGSKPGGATIHPGSGGRD
jgi:phosphatidylserine decarboxylase